MDEKKAASQGTEFGSRRDRRGRRAALGAAGTIAVAVAVWIGLARVRPAGPAAGRAPRNLASAGDAGRDRGAGPAALPDQVPTSSAASGEAYLDHAFRSVIQSRLPALGLTAAQVDRLVSDLLEFEEIHADVVGRFIQETDVQPDAVTLQVPPFPVEGHGVRDLLYQRLATDFPDKHQVIAAELGAYVEDAFRGFGATELTFVIRRTASPDVFEVESQGRVTEGAATSVDPVGTTYAGNSGVTLFSREQVRSGEYRFLAPILDRRFPEKPGETQ